MYPVDQQGCGPQMHSRFGPKSESQTSSMSGIAVGSSCLSVQAFTALVLDILDRPTPGIPNNQVSSHIKPYPERTSSAETCRWAQCSREFGSRQEQRQAAVVQVAVLGRFGMCIRAGTNASDASGGQSDMYRRVLRKVCSR